jgi:hypothetical protein
MTLSDFNKWLIVGLAVASPVVASAQGLRAPTGSLASDQLLLRYWEQGGLPGMLNAMPQPEREERPLLGGWSHSFSADSRISVGLGWQPGRSAEEIGHLGAAGASWRQRFYGLWDPVVTAGVSFLRQPHPESGEAGERYGAHLSLGLNPTRDWGISVGLAYRNAGDANPLASAAERADQRALYGDLAAVYRVQRNVELQGQISGVDLRSRHLREADGTREVGVRMRYYFD